ncbi:hypothetical protein Arub01_46830 [Actinomadura rubrobrunea]|uniref:Band 7 domain-containing protein n=1 Tax=Actinomadura rubrobrunea TaxID=115335 RepID=A0A9W6UWQ1_9ACTN|nr:SPFH domain-containing protein [Actinomadura rubrobrunea]GLW66439.1 hypothetical protein Arub01_46830 [Actinomadura rubrobrunea]
MTGALAAGGAALAGSAARSPEPFGAEPPPGVVLIVAAVAAAVIVMAATVRVVPGHQRLVVWRLGGAPQVRGPGLVRVLPGIDRWERVGLRMAPLEMWTQALTRDGVILRLKIMAVVSVVDPDRYAARAAEAPGAAGATAGVIVESQVRRHIARRDLTQLTGVVAAGGGAPVPGVEDDGHRRELEQWGLAVSLIQIVQADVPLHSLHHWAVRAASAVGGTDGS